MAARLSVFWLALAALGCAGNEAPARAPGTRARSTPSAPASPGGRVVGRWLAYSGLTEHNVRGSSAVWVDARRTSAPSPLPFVHSLAWSPNGRWIAGCTAQAQVAIIAVAGPSLGEPLRFGACGRLEWASGSQRLAVLTPKNVAVIDVTAAPQSREIAAPGRDRVFWSSSAAHLLLVRSGEGDQLFALGESGLERVPLNVTEGESTRCRFSTDGAALACSISSARTASLAVFRLDAAAVRAEEFALGKPEPITFREWTANAAVLLSTAQDSRLRLWPGFSTLLELPSGLDSFRLARSGNVLVDVTQPSVRIVAFGARANEQRLPPIAGGLVNPRIAPDEKSALVGVAQPRQSGWQADVWLIRGLNHKAVATRLLQAPADRVSIADFSAGSRWAIASLFPDGVPRLAESGSTGLSASSRETFAFELETGASFALAEPGPYFAPDDSALASIARADAGVFLRRTTSHGLAPTAERVGSLRSVSAELVWQP